MEDGVRGAEDKEALNVSAVNGGPDLVGGGGGVEGVWLVPH